MIFSTTTCNFETDTIVNNVSWSNVDQIAAMSTNTIDEHENETHQIHFINNEGALIPSHVITHSCPASIFEWQPGGKLLAIGWSDGMVSCWSIDTKTRPTLVFNNTAEHTTAITALRWNPAGKRLVTGDKMGQIVVWTVDTRGHMTATRQYRKKGEITAIVYCILPLKFDTKTSEGNTRKNDKLKNMYSPPFFFGTDKGTICYADDLGHCTDVQALASSIDSMLYLEETSRLIVITRSLLLTQYQVSIEGKVSRLNQVKLSIAGDVVDNGIKNTIWAISGLMVCATNEKMVRLFDIATDEAYNLPLSTIPVSEGIDIKNDRVSSVAFGPLDRCLAVGTYGGIVAVWKYIGSMRLLVNQTTIPSTSSADWEYQYYCDLKSPVLEIVWSHGQGILSVVTDDAISILSERIIHNKMNGALYVLQQNNTEVNVIYNTAKAADMSNNTQDQSAEETKRNSMYDTKYSEDSTNDTTSKKYQSWLINADMIIKGMNVSKTSFVLWNGKSAQIYRVNATANRIEQVHVMTTTSTAIAIADSADIVDDSLFICEEYTVKIYNFSGAIRGSLNFSEVEGKPIALDINMKYLAVITDKGYMKLFDIYTPTKVKALGTGTKFYSPYNNMEVGLTGSSSTAVLNTLNTGDMSGNKSGNTAASVVTEVHEGACMSIKSINVNCDGTRICLLVYTKEGSLQILHPHTCMYIYDRLKGNIIYHDFVKADHIARYPVRVTWDDSDDRILTCEVEKGSQIMSTSSNNTESTTKSAMMPTKSSSNDDATKSPEDEQKPQNETEIYQFFVSTEHGILIQDSFPKQTIYGVLLGVSVPHIYFKYHDLNTDKRKKSRTIENSPTPYELIGNTVVSITMRDFINMGVINTTTKLALLDFSYNLTLGKLDEAYRCVKSINNPLLWENMAQMCIKTKRIDVAEICFSQMGHARGAAALRESKKENDINVSVAVIAIQLGFYDEAISLYKESNRYDLINQLYQASGKYEKSMKLAKENDLLHVHTTHYEYAKYLESTGNITDAIEQYELSNTANIEVPRMLFHLGQLDRLEKYIHNHDDTILWKWWANYIESNGKLEKAFKYYQKAKDYISCVRLACYKEDYDQASDIVRECGDKAASYYLARQLENKGEIDAAITFYADAECLNHSIRLCQQYNHDTDLMMYALKSPINLILECAAYFEKKKDIEKAVLLYQKGGDFQHALELCLNMEMSGSGSSNSNSGGATKDKLSKPGSMANNSSETTKTAIYDLINSITKEMGDKTSPEILSKSVQFLIKNNQLEKAIEIYSITNKYYEAIEMCQKQNIKISEQLLDKLIPSADNTKIDANTRKEIFKLLAKLLKDQGSYALASKMYTQTGDRIKAMKCLILSGETKSVIQFATISRQRDIYILGGNYLQQMNWRENVDIMKSIILFYNKAKAFEPLASFFESCAQVEVDEYRDYEKACGAYREAIKYLKQSDTNTSQQMLSTLEYRVEKMEQFIKARNIEKDDPTIMISICQNLLQDPHIDEAVRVGDCLALLVEHYYDSNNIPETINYLKEMKKRKIPLDHFVDTDILDDIFKKNPSSVVSVATAVATPGSGTPVDRNGRNESKSNSHDDHDDDDSFRNMSGKPNHGNQGEYKHQQSSTNRGGGRRDQGEVDENEDEDDGINEELEEDLDEDDNDEDQRNTRINPGKGMNQNPSRGNSSGRPSNNTHDGNNTMTASRSSNSRDMEGNNRGMSILRTQEQDENDDDGDINEELDEDIADDDVEESVPQRNYRK